VTTLLLARHGETDWNRDLRFQGHADPPLNEVGRRQARELAASLAGEELAAIYCSDLRRAHETARIVADAVGAEVTILQGLREIDVGSWSGLTRDEIEERFPDGFERWREGGEGHDGESREELRARVVEAAERIAAAHPGDRVLLVTHGGALRALLTHAEGAPSARRFDNCSVVRIAVQGDEFRSVD
jgi:2,3-bisphosphoglycerate-dependent phosphoglycerate mutase